MAKDKELTTDDKFTLLLEVLAKQQSGITPESLQAILSENTKATQKALRPENEQHPNVSVYHPGGGPIAQLPYEVLYNGFPIHKALETHTDRERELLTQVQPGEYTIIRKDGSLMKVSARGEYDANQRMTKLEIQFPVTREEKHIIPPMQVVLYQLVHAGTANPRQVFIDAMREHMDMTLGASAAVGA